ncbi:hypothetical protein O6H91_Y527900 [Diphasiastrum complanatum]|nr:hypothetical protein O6H91_Y527900 [Diphasiastrum complanatum]KAJ7190301.1 hypothetical protein O6H91_Y527900 [Diphasiastrum complanatum]
MRMEETVAIEGANSMEQTLELPYENNVECESFSPAIAVNTTSDKEEYAFVQEKIEEVNQFNQQDLEQAENGDKLVMNENMHHEEQQKENTTSGQTILQPKLLKSKASSKRLVQSVSQLAKGAQWITGKGPSKSLSKADVDDISKRKRSTSEHIHVDASEALPLTSSSVLHRSPCLGSARANFTVPQPFALATDKRASLGNRPASGEVAKLSSKQPGNGCSPTFSIKKPQVLPKTSTRPSSAKDIHLEAIKSSNESKAMEVPEVEPATFLQALPSSPAKIKEEHNSKSMIGFNFKCDERAERRKEFYSKLEEKLNAKEAEKSEIQAKTQEELEAEIKELRKSLTFKAKPMPSFYQEAPPPKAELKKIPPTRAKSPKLGRRKSINGVAGNENVDSKSDDTSKSSDFGKNTSVPMKINDFTPKPHIKKLLIKTPSDKTIRYEGGFGKSKSEATSSFNGQPSCVDDESDEVAGSKVEGNTENSSPMAAAVGTSRVGLDDTHLSDHVRDDGGQECAVNNGPAVAVDELKEEMKEKHNQNSENQVFNTIHETQGVTAVGADRGKLRISKVSQHIVHSEGQEANEKPVKSFKRERLKASTPTISSLRREHTKAGSARSISKSSQGLSSTNTDVAVAS